MLILFSVLFSYGYSAIIKPVDISRWFNNDGIASVENMKHGDFDGGGCTYPAEEIYVSGSVLNVQGVKFLLSGNKKKANNNIQCKGQTLRLPKVNADKLYFLGSSHGGNYKENFNVVYSDGTEELIKVGLSDWCVKPQFNEITAVKAKFRYSGKEKQDLPCSIWLQEVVLRHPEKKISRLILPTKENMHIFAITYGKGKKSLKSEPSGKAIKVNNSGIVYIKSFFNNQAIASKDDKTSGDFDGNKYYYPAEGLASGLISVKNIPFKFYNTGKANDNIKCKKQKLILAKQVKGSSLYILGSAEFGNQQSRLKIIFTDGRSQYFDLGLTDWCSQEPAYAEDKALEAGYRCTPKGIENLKTKIWLVTLPLKKKNIKAILLPDNEHMHIFAMTIK